MNKFYLLSLFLIASLLQASAQIIPSSATVGNEKWEIKWNRTDEFNGTSVNKSMWQTTPENFGVWSWSDDNAFLTNGVLNIRMRQETHTRRFWDGCNQKFEDDFELYYKSGIVKSYAEGVYGYYEAKIKGASLFPGVSPAFWLYSDGHPYDNMAPGSIQYSEIDVVELQQAEWTPTHEDDVYDMDHNLHTRIANPDGKTVSWKRPGTHPDECRNDYRAPFDPRDDFHTYGVENRVDSIFWYVDGVRVAAKPNTYWHRPMHVTLSMGLRRHFTTFKCNQFYPRPESTTTEGFPTTMQVDYVRTWEAQPALWMDNKNKYLTTEYVSGGTMEVVCHYHPGSGFKVGSKWGGMTVKLIEKNASGGNVREYVTVDNSVLGKYGGTSTVSLSLKGVTPSNQLPAGHYYALVPVFQSTKGNIDVFVAGGIAPVKIIAPVAATGVSVSQSSFILKEGELGTITATVAPQNATNKMVSWSSDNQSVATIDANGLITALSAGTAYILATTADGNFTATSLVTVIAPVTGVSVSPASLSLKEGETANLLATIAPANASDKKVSWSSDNSAVATVGENGAVIGVSAGSANITVTTNDGNFTAIATVTVIAPVTGVSVDPVSLPIIKGESRTISHVISPANASNKSVLWHSDNTSVATVNNRGEVTALVPGNANIIVTTNDGQKTASTTVLVLEKANNEGRKLKVVYLVNRQTGKRIRPSDASLHAHCSEAAVDDNSDYTLWKRKCAGNGLYYFVNVATGYYLMPEALTAGSKLMQAKPGQLNKNMQWQELAAADGFIHLKNRDSQLFLNQNDNSASNEYQLADATDKWSQWMMVDATNDKLHYEDKGCEGNSEKGNQADVVVYPNPATDHINIKLNDHDGSPVTVSLIDETGRVVLKKVSKGNVITLETGNYKGMYLIKVESGKKAAVQKVIIQ